MKVLKKLFAPREIRAILGILDEVDYVFGSEAFREAHSDKDGPYWFQYEAFRMVRGIIEDGVFANTSEVVTNVREGLSPREYVYTMIANVSGDHVESGQYHLYRGVLNPLGIGHSLLVIFDTAEDELAALGAIDQEYAKKQKSGVRQNINSVG